jgi:hypothetical protein
VSNFSPAMAVPTTVKIPDPITAPMPNAVSDQGPSVFLRQCSGSSESLISLSIDLVATSCFRSVSAPEGSQIFVRAQPHAVRSGPLELKSVPQRLKPGI